MTTDFGFTTVSAEDYAALNKPAAPQQPAVDTTIASKLEVIFQMIQAIDDKMDAQDEKVDAIGNKVGAVVTTLSTSTGKPTVDRDKLVKMSEIILPLLKNLRDTAKDEYIRWANRGPICQSMINQVEALLA